MFSSKGKPLAQANIQNDSIRKLARVPKELSNYFLTKTQPSSGYAGASEIRNLHSGLKGVSFKAHVVGKSEVRAVTSKEGNPLLVCEVTLSDGTGEIPLSVWNNQIATVSKGDLVQIQNARVGSYRGRIQLSLSRKIGILTILKPT